MTAGIPKQVALQVVRLNFGVALDFVLDHPGLERTVALKPLENYSAKKWAWDAVTAYDKLLPEVEVFQKVGSEDSKYLADLAEDLSIAVENNTRISEVYLARLRKRFKSRATWAIAKGLIGYANDFYDANKAREIHAAENALNLPGKGIVIFGASHELGIRSNLLLLCRDRLSSSYSVAKSER
jgi:hypothetical protein